MVSEKKICFKVFFSHYKSIGAKICFKVFPHYKSMGANDPLDVANLTSRGMVRRTDLGDHSTFLHTESVSLGPLGFREEDFERFFTPPPPLSEVWPVWTSGA